MFDTSHRNLYVACTGDSRAVAGIYEEGDDGQGVWKVEVLTYSCGPKDFAVGKKGLKGLELSGQ